MTREEIISFAKKIVASAKTPDEADRMIEDLIEYLGRFFHLTNEIVGEIYNLRPQRQKRRNRSQKIIYEDTSSCGSTRRVSSCGSPYESYTCGMPRGRC